MLSRSSNSPEIGLSSSFGHLFIPIEFFSPLTSARAQSTSWREILLHPPFLPPGDLQQGDENDDQLLLGQLDCCWPHGHCLGTLSQVLLGYLSEYFPRKTDRVSHLWTTIDQSALCSLMKELSRKTDGADGEYFLPGETRGDFWDGGILGNLISFFQQKKTKRSMQIVWRYFCLWYCDQLWRNRDLLWRSISKCKYGSQIEEIQITFIFYRFHWLLGSYSHVMQFKDPTITDKTLLHQRRKK